jgi:hypothetical protein
MIHGLSFALLIVTGGGGFMKANKVSIYALGLLLLFGCGGPAGFEAVNKSTALKSTATSQSTSGTSTTQPTTPSTPTTPAQPTQVSASAFSMNCNEDFMSTAGSYTVQNNMWGKDGVYGSYSQCVGIRGNADGSTSARWTWSWPDGPNEVKGYPAIIYGQKPGFQKTPGSNLPIRLDLAQQIYTSWSEHSSYTGRGHLSYDLWLARDGDYHNGFNNNPLTHEIMIPAEPYGGYGLDRNPAWYIEQTTINGIGYKVYKADGFGTIGWRFLVLQPQGPMLSFNNFDWKPVFNYLRNKGFISGYEYLVSIEFGTEVQYGTGDVIIDSFRADVR